jgi:hypothetical protein
MLAPLISPLPYPFVILFNAILTPNILAPDMVKPRFPFNFLNVLSSVVSIVLLILKKYDLVSAT